MAVTIVNNSLDKEAPPQNMYVLKGFQRLVVGLHSMEEVNGLCQELQVLGFDC